MAKKCVVNYNGKGEVSSMSVRNLNYGKNPIRARQKFQNLVENLMRTGLGDKIFTDWKEFKKVAGVTRNDFVGNNVRGAVSTKNGYIYINKNDLKPDTLIHEYTHLWFDYMKHNNKPLYNKFLNKIKENKELMDSVRNDKNYANIRHDENLIADEVLAREVGARGLKQIQQPWLFDMFREFWDYVKSLFGAKNTSISEWSEEQWRGATFGEVTREMVRSLIKGENIKKGKAVSSDTLLHSILDQNDFDVDGSVKQEVLDEIKAEKEHIREQSIVDGTYLKAPNGADTNLTEEQWLLTRTRRFKEWFGDFEVSSKINISNLNEVSNLADDIIKGNVQSKRLDELSEQGRLESGKVAIEAAIIVEQALKDLQNEKNISQRVSQASIGEGSEISAENDAKSSISKRSERAGRETTSEIGIQEEVLENYAKQKGIWFENVDGQTNQFGEFLKSGNENIVYLDNNSDGSVVTKVNNLNYVGGNPILYLDYIAMFNGTFKGATIEVVGFTRLSDGGFGVITQQPFIQAEEGISANEVSEYMQNLGFTEIGEGDFLNDSVYVQDMHMGNVMKDVDGNIIIIDNIMEFNSIDDGFGGQHKRGQINTRENENVSKVVDENGEPLVVYHTTKREFTAFDESFSLGGDMGSGFYFGENQNQLVEEYGNSVVMNVFLNMRLPRVEKNRYGFDNIIDDAHKYDYKDNGGVYQYLRDNYDGIIVTDPILLTEQKGRHFIVFNPNQIKSAKDNVGTFSKENDDIRFMETDDVGSDNFKRWSKGYEILEGEGVQGVKNGDKVIIRAYHGTTHDFNVFDSSIKGNVGGHLGRVNYFTTSENDAEQNYGAKGADLRSRIEQLTDTIEYDIDNLSKEDVLDIYSEITLEEYDEISDSRELAHVIAERRLNGGNEHVKDLYLKLNNPVVLGEKASWFENIPEPSETAIQTAVEELADEYGITEQEVLEDYEYEVRSRVLENEGAESKILTAIETALSYYDLQHVSTHELLGDLIYENEVDLNKVEKTIRDNSVELYDENSGEYIGSQIVADFFEELGFDGIILTDVAKRFNNMGLGYYTSHIHVFDKNNNQIKLTDGTNTTFDENSNDIRFLFGNTNNVSPEQITQAEQLEQQGKTEQEIIKDLGVIKNQNNVWVPVIDNNIQSVISNKEVNEIVKYNKLQDGGENVLIDDGVKLDFEKVFKFDELFEHYPEFKNKLEVLLYEDQRKIPQNEGGFAYLSKRGSLGIAIQAGGNSELSIGNKNEGLAQFEGAYPTVLHEIQHLIQLTNGEVVGTHPSIMYDELVNDRMRIYNAEGNKIDLNLLADSYIRQGLAKDINDFYMRFSMDLYLSFLGEINARAAEKNSYTNVLSEVGLILFPVSKNEYVLSDKRLNITPYVAQRQSNLGSSVIGEKGAGKVATYHQNLQTAKRYEEQGRTPEFIEQETGWYKVKGEWKMISNEAIQNFKFKKELVPNKKMSLNKVIQDNILFKMYPELKNLKVVFANEYFRGFPRGFDTEHFFKRSSGTFDREGNAVYINISQNGMSEIEKTYNRRGGERMGVYADFAVKELLKTLAHETQHFIQTDEGHRSNGGGILTITKDLLNSIGIKEDQYNDVETVEDLLAEFIFSKGWDTLPQQQRDDIKLVYEHLNAFKNNNYRYLVKEYRRILGEVDARIVERVIDKHSKGQNNFSYKQELQEEMDRHGWTEEDLHVPQENPLDFLKDPFTKNFAFLPEIIKSRDDIELQNCR